MSCHAICRIKKYRTRNDVFRNKLRKYDGVSDIVSTGKLQDNEYVLVTRWMIMVRRYDYSLLITQKI